MSEGVPERFGNYELRERIGAGGMAEVFRATRVGAAGVEKVVALKRMLPLFGGEPEFVSRFCDEARIAMALGHTNIAQVFDFGEEAGSWFLAMELVDGLDLAQLMGRARAAGERIPVPITCFVVAEAARGLDFAHGWCDERGQPLGIVHRDVSPANVLLSRAGDVKIADFGIAKATGKLHKTQTGAVMGKFRYMSPEQVEGTILDRKSDLFSLGVVLWELLAGQTLFAGENIALVTEQVRRAEVPPPSTRQPDVPPELDRITLRALARAPRDRYDRAAELARELGAHLARTAPGFAREDVGAYVTRFLEESATPTSPRTTPERPRARLGAAEGAAISEEPTLLDQRPGRASASAPSHGRTDASAPGARRAGASRVLVVGGAGLLLVGGVLSWRYFLSPPGAVVHLEQAAPLPVATDGSQATSAPAAAAPAALALPHAVDPVALAACERALDATAQGHLVARRGVLSEDFLVLASAVNEAFGGATASGPGPLSDELGRRVAASQLVREVQAATGCLFEAGALPPGFRAALENFLRRNDAFSAGAVHYDVTALSVLISPSEPQRWVDLISANAAFQSWREQDGLINPALRRRQAAIERLAALDANHSLVKAARRFGAAAPKGQLGGLELEALSGQRSGPEELTLRLRAHNPGAQPLVVAAQRLAPADGQGNLRVLETPEVTLAPGETRELELRCAWPGRDEPLVFAGPPPIRAFAGPLR
jgi:serine/threonine protein kinase